MSDEHERRPVIALAGPGIMLLSAAIFGYFGFMTAFRNLTVDDPPQLIPMVVLLEWTLKASAIAFLISALITIAATRAGNLFYALVGIVSAVLFVVVAIWDVQSPFTSGVHPFYWWCLLRGMDIHL